MPSDEIIYSCPFVPRPLVAAYGLRPRRLIPDAPSPAACRAGVCPFAHDFTQAAMALPAAGIVFTTLCDQMRRQAELAAAGATPVFCLNVPRTWQDPACGRYYLSELRRLGRFLERIGGRRPSDADLTMAIKAEVVSETSAEDSPRRATHSGTVPIALLGGPLPAGHWLLDLLDELGLHLALDATETGLAGQPWTCQGPSANPLEALAGANYKLQITNYKSSDPLETLAVAYFAGIHHPNRFPASHMYDWLLPQLAGRDVRAIVLRYYAWCDPWHAQAHRLAQRSGLSVIELDGRETPQRARTRLQAILEMAE